MSNQHPTKFNEIAYVTWDAKQKEFAVKKLLLGTIALRKWAEFYHPRKFRQFRNDVMRGDKNPQCKIPEDRIGEFHQDLPNILAIRKSHSELSGRSIEQTVLENFAAMAKLFATKWCTEDGVSQFDYLQEAYMTVIESLYQYVRPDIDICTFVWSCLKNRMINVKNQSNLFCPLTNSDLSLVIRYEKAKQTGGTFDEIVKTLGLSEDEGSYLGIILNKVVSENQIDDPEKGELRNDYTSQRMGIEGELLQEDFIDQTEEVKHTLDKAKLVGLERAVIEQAMNPYWGWQSEFANNHINPETQKPYSRMRITQILHDAQKKVAKVLKRKAIKQ